MGIRLIEWSLDDTPPDLTAREVLALVAIAHRANDTTRTGWPGAAEIARRIRATDRTARRVLADLVERGLLERVSGGHRGQAAVYRFPVKADTAVSAISGEKGGHLAPERRTPRARKADTAVSSQPSGTVRNRHPRARDPSGVTPSTQPADDDRTDHDAIRAKLAEIGSKRTDDAWTRAVIVEALRNSNGAITDATRYVLACIDRDPDRFRPTPSPPHYERDPS